MTLARAASWLTWQFAGDQTATGRRIPVLSYHRVLPEYREGRHPIYTVFPEQFASQMAFLREAGFASLSLTDYAEIAGGWRPPPQRAVLITFDDGYADNYHLAWPIAARYAMQINLFVCTRLVGLGEAIVMTEDGYVSSVLAPPEMEGRGLSHLQKFPHLWRPLTWQELAEMQDSGVEIGFHGHGHRNMASLTAEEITADIAAGITVFERQLGYRPQFFAFPYGGYDSYNPEVVGVIRRFGLDFMFAAHLGRARFPSAPTVLPRLPIYQEDNLAVFQRKIFGGYDWVGQIQRLEHLMRLAARKVKPV
jgi:peptidoglycan/xylan/chitin deacetylase (PgdA/CDA1 family)